jgi:enterochelin esterase-like enzyme
MPRRPTVAAMFVALALAGPFPAQAQDMIDLRTVHADRRITFRVEAPTARSVTVKPMSDNTGLLGGPFKMARNGDGTWEVTTPPAESGFFYYELLIDGVAVADPSCPPYFGWGKYTSGVDVPEPGVTFYKANDVPHGDVRTRWYHSALTGRPRRAIVYTPPDYDAPDARDRRYPVLYLQHGAGENELGWTAQGRANFILDNAIAAARAVPMIVVMDNGYAAPAGAPAAEHRSPRGAGNLFDRVLLEELIPQIDRGYRTLADRDHRAIAGLSMGAGQALTIGLGHLDTFASIGAFSGGARAFDPATSYGGAFAGPADLNGRLRLLFLSNGHLDDRFAGSVEMHEALERTGVNHVWHATPGRHEWQAWRHHLHALLPMLFTKQ